MKKKKASTVRRWIPILVLVIIVIGITFYMIHDIQKKIEARELDANLAEKNMENAITEENNIAENVIDNTSQKNNVVETNNNAVTNIVDSTVSNNTSTTRNIESTSQSQNTTTNVGVTDQKQKAIELVKKEWGEDDSVEFVFDYVNENGEYVICVKEKASATAKSYFRVNLETETVELD